MTPAALTLADAERRLVARCLTLAERLDAGEESAWPEYTTTVAALTALTPAERRPLETTKELAARLNVTPRTARKLSKDGKLHQAEAVRLGKRGTAAIRWRSA